MTTASIPRFAVIGHPVAHSQSPWIHHAFGQQAGIVLHYEKILAPLDGFRPTVETFFGEGGRGLNVTLPFKEEAWTLAGERLSPRARLAGAANTLWIDASGAIHACNTDGAGLVMDLERLGHAPRGRRVLLLGAGGAARGALPALLEAGCARVHVANRSPEKAERLCADMADYAVDVPRSAGALTTIAGQWDLVINATSSSLSADRPLEVQPGYAAGALAYDMVYAAQETAFLGEARRRGAASCADGLGMLVGQAAVSFEIWHGVRPRIAPVLQGLRRHLMQQ